MKIILLVISFFAAISLLGQPNSGVGKNRTKHSRKLRDSLIGEFIYSPNSNTGRINLYEDSTAIISAIPGCYSCFVLDDCGIWRIKRKFLIIESYPKDNLLESKFLNDSCITIINTEEHEDVSFSAVAFIHKNGTANSYRFLGNGILKISKKEVDSIAICNLGLVKMIYNKTGAPDYYKFSLFRRCLSDRTRYKFRISANYTLKGVLSGKKVKLIKNSNVPDLGRRFWDTKNVEKP